jgi:hypothetical protein
MSEQKSPLRAVYSCQDGVMKFYQHAIKQQTALLARIKAILPPSLAEHALSCMISDRKLLLFTSAEQWQPLLNFYQPTILDLVCEITLAKIDAMEVRVLAQFPGHQTIRKIEVPSKSNIDLIRHTVDTIEDDDLKQALLRLSQTLGRLSIKI